ncbi:MAG: hypothetical protein GY791_01320 [Alphaproteobacteria bacterium]|nr:hypothetical protein [Alphaproteobacteria bacterium]
MAHRQDPSQDGMGRRVLVVEPDRLLRHLEAFGKLVDAIVRQSVEYRHEARISQHRVCVGKLVILFNRLSKQPAGLGVVGLGVSIEMVDVLVIERPCIERFG